MNRRSAQKRILFWFLLVCILFSFKSQAAINEAFTFQGKIVNTDGTNLTNSDASCVSSGGADTCDFRVSIYDHASTTGPSLKWQQVFYNVELYDNDGIFNLVLDGSNCGGSNLFADCYKNSATDAIFQGDLWVEVEFDSDGDGTSGYDPNTTGSEAFTENGRKKLTAVPYAFNAKNADTATSADTLDSIDSSSFLRSDTATTFAGGNVFTMAGTFDSNGDVSFADTDITLDGVSTTFTQTTGGITFVPASGQDLNINLAGNGDFIVNTDDLFVDTSLGLVGIGTTDPYATLQINGTLSMNNNAFIGGSASLGLFLNTYGVYTYGMYRNGNDDLAFRSNLDTEQMVLQATTGYLGLGTTLPGVALDVIGSIRSDANIYTGDLYMGYDDASATISTSNTDENLTIDPNGSGKILLTGNVGIGTTNPLELLEINNVSGTARIKTSASTNQNGLSLTSGGTDRWIFGQIGSVHLDIYDDVNNGTVMRFEAGGDVGVGTTNPTHKLDVAGNIGLSAAGYINFGATDGDGGYGFRDVGGTVQYKTSGGSWQAIGSGGGSASGAAGAVQFSDGATFTSDISNFFWDDTTDSLGLGTSTPAGRMSLGLDSSDTYGYYTNTTSDFTGSLLYLAHNDSRIFEVSDVQAVFEVPVNMASSGDVSIANNINFTNLTSSYITSDGPMYIQAGNVGEAESLYLSSAGSGNVYVDDDLYVTGESYLETGNKLVFDSDDSSDTYFYHDTANNRLSLTIDNVEQVRFLSSGSTSMDLNTVVRSNAFDVAEMYPTADESISSGMVVSLEENALLGTYTLSKSLGSSDRTVLGIISTKPGVLMGGNSFQVDFCDKVTALGEEAVLQEELQKYLPDTETLEDISVLEEQEASILDKIALCKAIKEVPVTLSGRVPVKIAPDSATIRVGDNLTVSDTYLGYAQKALLSTDVIVGRSLENWTPGEEGNSSIMAVTGIIWNSSQAAMSLNSPEDLLTLMDTKLNEFKIFAQSLGFHLDESTNVLDINSDLNVMGAATLADVTITGELNIGLMEIDSLNNSINVLGSSCNSNITLCEQRALYLQKNLSGNVDIFNGKIVLAPTGDMSVSGELTVNVLSANKVNIDTTTEITSAGKAVIMKGNSSVVVHNTAATTSSLVFVTPVVPVKSSGKVLEDGKILLEIEEPLGEDLEIQWWVIN